MLAIGMERALISGFMVLRERERLLLLRLCPKLSLDKSIAALCGMRQSLWNSRRDLIRNGMDMTTTVRWPLSSRFSDIWMQTANTFLQPSVGCGNMEAFISSMRLTAQCLTLYLL